MAKDGPDSHLLGTSEQVAQLIADTLVGHGFFEKSRFKEAVASIKWELDAQHGMGRIALKFDDAALDTSKNPA